MEIPCLFLNNKIMIILIYLWSFKLTKYGLKISNNDITNTKTNGISHYYFITLCENSIVFYIEVDFSTSIHFILISVAFYHKPEDPWNYLVPILSAVPW